MSWFAAVLVWVAGLHLATAAFVAMHQARHPSDRDLASLSWICSGQAIAALANAYTTEASTYTQAVRGQQALLVGAIVSLAAFASMAVRITDAASHRATRVIHGWSGLAMLATLTGACFLDAPRAPRTFGFAWAPDYQEARYSVLGLVAVWSIFPAAMYVVRQMNARPRYTLGKGAMWIGFTAGTLAFVNDTLVRFGPLRSVYLSEIASLVMALNATMMLRGRFAAAIDELRLKTAELELSSLELEQMQAQLVRRQQLAAVGELSAVIAHEVRNPIAIIKNAISALRRGPNDATPQLLAIVREEVARLQRLVSDLSTYTRPLTPRVTTTQVAPLIHRAISRTRAAAATDHLHIDVHIDSDELCVSADPDLLETALGNVLDNAVQATATGGSVTVRCAGYEDGRPPCTVITVIDTGSGMTEQVAAKAKEPFFTTRSTGTGLGLAIVDRVMRAHDGHCAIDTNPQGTSIALTFPAASAR